MFGSEKLKFQVLTAVSRFGTSIHPLSASLENALLGKNKNLKNVVVVEGYKKWSTQIARQVAIYNYYKSFGHSCRNERNTAT
jgi:hypothetical protein